MLSQESVAAMQKSIVETERQIVEALRAQPSPRLIDHLITQARIDSAKRLQNQSTYLYRLEAREVDQIELSKAGNVQDRFRAEQAMMLAALISEPAVAVLVAPASAA